VRLKKTSVGPHWWSCKRFLAQKFDLFLKIASTSFTAQILPERSHIVGDTAGLLLIVLMVFVAIRFRKTALDINAREVKQGPGRLLDITLATLHSCWARSCSSIYRTR
jgi:hypothetical protein